MFSKAYYTLVHFFGDPYTKYTVLPHDAQFQKKQVHMKVILTT